MPTKPSPSASKKRGEKGESSLRRSLRIVELPAEVVPKAAEKSEPSRPTSEVSAFSAEAEGSQPSEPEPSAVPEAPLMPENVVPSPSSSEVKTSEAGQSDGASAQPSTRVDGDRSQGVRAESESVVLQTKSNAGAASSQPRSVNPEPTAADPRSSQVEGGALNSLKYLWTQLKIQGSASTGTNPVRLSYTPEPDCFGLSGDGSWPTSVFPEQHPVQWSRDVPEVAGAEGLGQVRLPEMIEAEMIIFGRSQLVRWMASPPGVVNPTDVAYAPCANGHDIWEFIRAASTTARHLMRVTRSPSARWLNVFNAERRRIQLVSDLKAVRVSLRLMPPIACVTLLQTMLHEAGYGFLNQVPAWHTLSELSSVPESQIRFEIEQVGYFIEAELVTWNAAVSSTTSYVRSLSESQLLDYVQTAESQVGFPLDKDGDDIMDKDTQLLLGAEVVLQLRLTGLRARGPVSRIQDESSGKHQLLSAGGVIPKGRGSSESVSETRRVFAKDPEHSMVGVGPSSDTSLVTTDKGVSLSGLSSSGSSLMSVTDVMVGTGTHMPMSGATVTKGIATCMTRSSFPGMAISVTSPVSCTSVQTGTGTFRPKHLAHISLSDSPESKRRDEQKVEVAEARYTHPGYSGGRPDSDRFVSSGASAETPNFDQQYQCDLTRSEANAWVDFDAEQCRRMAALADSRNESAKFYEVYLKCQAASIQLTEAQQKIDIDYWNQAVDLEKVAEKHFTEAAEMCKADEIRAQYYLGTLKELQEAEDRAKQAELQMVHDKRAAKIRVQYELASLRLNEEAQTEHDRAGAEQDRKIQRFQTVREQHGACNNSSDQAVGLISLSTQTRISAETLMFTPVSDPVLDKLDPLIELAYQLDRANIGQVQSARSSDMTSEARGLSQNGLVRAKAHTSNSVSKRIGHVHAAKSKKRDGGRWDSNDSICSDSAQDELKSQFGAAAQAEDADTGSRSRGLVHTIVPRDALETFDERTSLEDRVNWWERFMHFATGVPWDEKARIVQLRMRLSGSLSDWYTQLPDSTRLEWNRLSHVLKKDWSCSIDSKAERYYAMEMRDSETPRMFVYWLNRAAKKASIALDGLSTDREAHIRRFVNALGDTQLRITLRGQPFDTLGELEETLKRIEGLNQDVRREDQVYQQKVRPTRNMPFDRFGFQQRRSDSRVFLAEGFGRGAETENYARFYHEAPSSCDENIEVELTHQAPRTDALESQSSRAVQNSISAEPRYSTGVDNDNNFRVAERLICKPRSDYPPYRCGTLQREEIRCTECGSEDHNPENCWSKLICGRCNDEGHPTQYCRSPPCSECGDYHRRGLCGMWSALKATRDKVRAKGSAGNGDRETIRFLLDSSDSEKPVDFVRKRVRDGSKSQALCAFAYVVPALPCWRGGNSKCMSSANQASDQSSLTEIEDSSSELEFDNNVEFALTYGDRHGWRSDHVLVGGERDTAMVHGAIFNRRTQIWMDTGAMTSMMSLDFARKLKLKLRRGYRLRVSEFGDVPRYATAKATIKLTLGVSAADVMDIWVGNISAGLDCLLGMDFMTAAGVRLCAQKGVVRLPDEESLFLVGSTEVYHVGLEIDVSLAETVRLQPGRSVVLSGQVSPSSARKG